MPIDAAGPNSPAEFGKICSVRRQDDCTLKVVLALPCPPRQLVYAPALDVGVTPGGSQLIQAGAPASCATGSEVLPSFAPESSDARAGALYVRLTHGVLAMRAPEVRVTTPALASSCHASAEGENSALRSGGVMSAAEGAVRLHVRCTCTASVGQQLVNLTLTLRLPDYTSPIVTFPHVCA